VLFRSRLDLLVGIGDLLGLLVTGGVAPPGEAQRGGAGIPAVATTGAGAAGGVGAAGGEGGEAGNGHAEGKGGTSGKHRISFDRQVRGGVPREGRAVDGERSARGRRVAVADPGGKASGPAPPPRRTGPPERAGRPVRY